jgi:hypothetical protein
MIFCKDGVSCLCREKISIPFLPQSDTIRRAIESRKMCNAISLTPGFSPVRSGRKRQNRFNGFPRADKPLKRLVAPTAFTTRLKPGVNENGQIQ